MASIRRRWYPPEQHPDYRPLPAPPVAQQIQQAPPGMTPAMTLPGNGYAVTALVLGIVGAVFGLIPILAVIALASGLIGLIFGIVGLQKSRRQAAPRKGMAIAGIATSGLAIVLAIAGFVIVSNAFDELDEDLDEIDREFSEDLEDLSD